MEYPNFYENLPEALKRLWQTVVLYDGEPFYIRAICAHRDDGIFRVYMHPLGTEGYCRLLEKYHREDIGLGHELDQWLETDEGRRSQIIRKRLDSRKFNRFRPFPLGMCNFAGRAYYLERTPNRKTEQGLIPSMVLETPVTCSTSNQPVGGISGPRNVDLWSNWFRLCVKGEYPDPDTCLQALLDPDVTNESAAFHREFALVRGPLNMLFLAYQQEVIGLLPNSDFSLIHLGKNQGYLREVVEELKLFQYINVR